MTSSHPPARRDFRLIVPVVAGLLGLAALGGAFLLAKPSPPMTRLSQSPGDSTALADSARRLCRRQQEQERTSCYESVLVPIVASHGVQTAMGTLNQLGSEDEGIRADGHVYAHAIGIAAGKASTDVGATFARCTEIFQSGCYHGVIQAYFETVDQIDTAAVNALCRSYSTPQADQWLRFQCVHGMGHGLTMFYEHHLPRALESCDLLRQSWDRESCYGGAFMENVVNATAPHHPGSRLASGEHAHHASATAAFKALDPDDLLYPCSVMAERYLNQCYQMQTSVMLHFTGGDIARAARTCLRAPSRLRAICHQSLGRDISAYARQDHGEAIRHCGAANAEYQPWCHVGVAKNLVDLTARPEDGLAYCQDVPGQRSRLKCYEAIGEQLGVLYSELPRRAATCDSIEEPFRSACRYGARLAFVAPPELPTD